MASGSGEQLQRALDLGYAYLNRRDRTVSEVRAQLARKGISEELGDAAIQTLAEQGMLDDARFARLFVSDKRRLEGWGSERIRRGLLTRGIERDLVQAALEGGEDGEGAFAPEAFDSGARAAGAAPGAGTAIEGDLDEPRSELERALAVLRRRFPQPPQDRRERERALGVLLRKGYESDLALDALAAHGRGD